MQAIIITTIQLPTNSLLKFAKERNFSLFVAGDNKTPKDWHLNNALFISILQQEQKFPNLSKLVAKNHYARKNFAYLEAIANGATHIFDTDDDNFPNNFFPNFIHDAQFVKIAKGKMFTNVYSFFTKQHVWPRGLPLNYIHESAKHRHAEKIKPLIQQSLADLDPDVDAIYRLTNGKTIRFEKRKIIALTKGTYSPFNSQSTYWHRKVFPLLYLPSTVDSRVTDIWRGYIAQRILWEIDSRLIFLSPCVYQKRNIHNLMEDFHRELDLYSKTEEMVQQLNAMRLSGTISDMLVQIYKELVKFSFFKYKEIETLKVWLKYQERLSKNII